MPNMSYCRFENTYQDLDDCFEHMDDTKELSESEAKYRSWLIDLCMRIAEQYGDEPEDE